jgi:hypothetical protein
MRAATAGVTAIVIAGVFVAAILPASCSSA